MDTVYRICLMCNTRWKGTLTDEVRCPNAECDTSYISYMQFVEGSEYLTVFSFDPNRVPTETIQTEMMLHHHCNTFYAGKNIKDTFIYGFYYTEGKASITSLEQGDKKLTAHIKLTDESDTVYVRYRSWFRGSWTEWTDFNEALSRTGSGAIEITGLDNNRRYQVSCFTRVL